MNFTLFASFSFSLFLFPSFLGFFLTNNEIQNRRRDQSAADSNLLFLPGAAPSSFFIVYVKLDKIVQEEMRFVNCYLCFTERKKMKKGNQISIFFFLLSN